jgi:cytochrome P450
MEDNFIGKIPIPKGTVLTIQPVGNHYNEQYFKNPE